MSEPKEEIGLYLQQMKEGSISAFEPFYERFVSLVYPIAYQMMGDRMEAEDVCHDVFLEVWNKAGEYDCRRGSIEAWLVVKTKSRCLDRLRRKKRMLLRDLDSNLQPRGFSDPAEELALSNIQSDYLRRAIDRLSLRQKQAILGMYYDNHTQKELSIRMKQPLGTIKSLIRYGINNLRKQLQQMEWMELPGEGKKHE